MRLPDFEQTIKLFGIIGALATFVWGVFVWRDKAREDRAAIAREQERVAITRRIEATRPFLEHQLAIYVDAIKTVETIATLRGLPLTVQPNAVVALNGDRGQPTTLLSCATHWLV